MARGRRFRHNQGGGAQPKQKMFNVGREGHFRYYAKDILADAPLDEDNRNAFLQQLVTRATRGGIDDAKEFVREKVEGEGVLDEEAGRKLTDLLERYSTYR